MYFDSFAELLHMDGHGVFVWSAYLLSLFIMLLLFVQPMLRHKRLKQEIRASILRRHQHAQQAGENR